MPRILDTATLSAAAGHLAAEFLQPDRIRSSSKGQWVGGPSYVMQELYNYMFRDEQEFVLAKFKPLLGSASMDRFRKLSEEALTPRSEETLHALLAERLAIDPDGGHIPGRIGTVDIGGRMVGRTMITVETPASMARRTQFGLDKFHRETHQILVPVYWPVYAGEGEERIADSGVADDLPPGTEPLPLGALVTRIGNAMAIAMANAGVDLMDEGTLGGVIQGRTTPRPAQVDDAVTGTNLFTLTLSATGFGAATDAAPGALKTAAAITSDTSADATGTLAYCRVSSSSVADTPLNDHIEGEAGLSGADFNFNTLAIVSGAAVDMTSYTIIVPES